MQKVFDISSTINDGNDIYGISLKSVHDPPGMVDQLPMGGNSTAVLLRDYPVLKCVKTAS
jgi:hypothetical protein